MKYALALCLLALDVGLAQAASAPPVAGRWENAREQGVLEVYACGDKVCARGLPSEAQLKAGVVVKDVKNKNPALRDRSLNGLQVMEGFTGGPTVWTDGSIYRPADGNTYKGRLELQDANTLKLTGCVVAPLCQSQIWKRTP